MKRIISILLIVILVLSLGACSNTEEPNDDVVEDTNNNEDNPVTDIDESDEDDAVDAETEVNSQEVTLYFENMKYIEIGDESLEKTISETRTIEFEDTTLEEAVVRELMKGPEDDVNLSSSFPETINLLDVKVEDKTAYVNFSSEGMNGGSLQEFFVIEQTVSSLLELDNIDKVQFLLDGEVAESLMGHYEVSEPFGDTLE